MLFPTYHDAPLPPPRALVKAQVQLDMSLSFQVGKCKLDMSLSLQAG